MVGGVHLVQVGDAGASQIAVGREHGPREGARSREGQGGVCVWLTHQRIHHVGLHKAMFCLQLFSQVHQHGLGELRFWRRGVAFPMVQKRLVSRGLFNGHGRRNALHLFQGPPGPPDAQIFQQAHGISEPHVGVFPSFPEIKRHLVSLPQRQGEGQGRFVVVAPVFVGGVSHVAVPRWGEACKVVGEPVAFKEQQVLRVHLPNAVGALLVQGAKGFTSWQIPVGLVQHVVPCHPRFFGVVGGNPLPEGRHLVAVGGTFPQGWFR